MLNWAVFSVKLSKQNKEINMSADCTGGKTSSPLLLFAA